MYLSITTLLLIYILHSNHLPNTYTPILLWIACLFDTRPYRICNVALFEEKAQCDPFPFAFAAFR